MDIQDLKPIIELMTLQEERLSKKISEVHDDVKETRDQAKQTNGRIQQAEKDIIKLQGAIEGRKEFCAENQIRLNKKFDEIVGSGVIIKHLSTFSKSPKLFLFGFVGFVVVVQIIVLEAVEKNWVAQLLDYIKP